MEHPEEALVAQMQPSSGGKVEGMSDVTYDTVTLLSNCGEAVDALDTYIEDAKRSNDPDAQRLFEQIRNHEIQHCGMLRNLISQQVKQAKF